MSTREMLYQDIAVLTDAQIEELAEFVEKIKQRKKNNADEVDALCGILHEYANPDLIPSEKTAWEQAAAEKHLRILEEMKHENS